MVFGLTHPTISINHGLYTDHREQASEVVSRQPSLPGTTSPAVVNVNAPVFVPKGIVPVTATAPSTEVPINDLAPLYPPASANRVDNDLVESVENAPPTNGDLFRSYDQTDPSTMDYTTALAHGSDMYGSHMQMMSGHEPYSMAAFSSQPLDYHLYNQQPKPSSSSTTSSQLFISDALRQELQLRAEDLWSSQSSSETGLPVEVHNYHSLSLLKTPGDQTARSTVGSYGSVVYKAVNKNDGNVYVLRRIEGFRLNFEATLSTVDQWTRILHPNLITVKEAFTTRDFGDSSLIFVFEYHPRAQSLYQTQLASAGTRARSPTTGVQISQSRSKHHGGAKNGDRDNGSDPFVTPLSEQVIWSYVVQLGSAIKAVHERGKAIRSLDLKTTMVTGKNRLKVDCCGVMDVVVYNPALSVEFLQQEDLLMFGKLLLSICCSNSNASNNLAKAMETIARIYSQDVCAVIVFLLSKASPKKASKALKYTDDLEHELMGELENARIVRLMSKLGFINERPQFNHDPRWSETGDRYIIKLFRDYLFHQVDQDGKPVLHMTHVLSCLNKLDAGSAEQIMLVSRDEQSCLVVSYEAIKMCIEQSFK
ncbi:PAB-dependent poly(A)-specific ribonuclease subunit 3 [Tulasnella sp. 331]|nr:PAB-dependent poly(A)-specific ribonuclease subunit 3 [Tulasnella sp. 331]